MDKKRRDFLKIAGVSTLAGLGAPAVMNRLLTGTSPMVAEAAHEVDAAEHVTPMGHDVAAGSHGESPAETPSGNRYGMVVDVGKFIENPGLAEKCIKACHSIHNVPDFPDKKDEIKWIWLTGYENAFPDNNHKYGNEELEGNKVLVFCNHCDNPPCVRACPTQATFRNKDGVIMMDYHRCIGCRFCMAACPYGSRSFNWRDPRKFLDEKAINREFPTRMRGVVEKCTFCYERVALGKKPACVEAAAEHNAMIFGNLNDENSEIRKVLKEKYTIQRKPSLGTRPSVFYII